MIKTIRKIFFIWQFEEEEKWLNEMSAKGQQLCGVGFCTYHFKEATPNEYTYRLEMLENMPTHAKSVQYIKFLEDTGIEHIGSIFRWVYFRKKTNGEAFDIYSDIKSRISHLNRMMLLLGILTLANLINTLNMFSIWIRSGMTSTLTIVAICLAACVLLGYGFISTYIKKRALKKEKMLHE